MKKIFLYTGVIAVLSLAVSCSSTRLGNFLLTQADAAAAIRQMLELGSKDNLQSQFGKDQVIRTLFPQEVSKVLTTLEVLGMKDEVDRFTNTLATAAGQTATTSVPIFVNSINQMSFADAIRIVKDGGTSATDYLRSTAGDSLRRAIAPIMQTSLEEYKLNQQWDKIARPVQALTNNKINLNLGNLMAAFVAEAMFKKIEEKEVAIRTQMAARTTPLLQRVFGRTWQ